MIRPVLGRLPLLLAFAGLAGAPAVGAAQAVPASAFDQIADLDGYIGSRLGSAGRGEENQELVATFRMQLDRGLITEEQYAEAVRAFGGGPLTRGGRPFSGVVFEEPDGTGPDRIEATFDEGRVARVVYTRGDGSKVREIVVEGGVIRETHYWGRPYEGSPRNITVYPDEYMGGSTTRTLTPSGELIQETPLEGGLRPGPGWIGGLNMWDADNAFYRSVESCDPVKLYMGGSYFEVLGPRGGGCAVEYGHWSTPEPSRPAMAGKSMVCVHGGGSAYDFINTLHGLDLPSETCRGPLADLLREWKGIEP